MHIYFENILVPLLVLLPNILYLILSPNDEIKPVRNVAVFEVMERVGQLAVFTLPLFLALIFNRFAFVGAALSLLSYYIVWTRYFLYRKAKYLFSPIAKIPIPLAIFPICYLLFCSLMFGSTFFYLSLMLFSVGHLLITYKSSRLYQNPKI